MKRVIAILFGALAIIFASSAVAETLDVSNNGAGSTNNINITQSNQTNVNQSNQMNANNDINASADTGGNSGSADTGDATVRVTVTNDFNHNWADVDTCCQDGANPTPKTSPVPGGGTPTPGSTGGGNGGDGGSGGDGGGGSSSGGVGGAAVMGLSATDGEISWQTLFYLASAACILVARGFLRGAA